MATIRRRKIGTRTYYYLEHTMRAKGKIIKKEKYLGKRIPEDIINTKKEFLASLYRQRWHPCLESIRNNYAHEQKETPASAREDELAKFSVHFTYDTQRIEGSTLSLHETANLLERGITPNAKPTRDAKQAEAHKALFYEVLTTKKDLSLFEMLHWHRMLFISTRPDIAGKIRKHQVRISQSAFIPPTPVEMQPLLDAFFRWYHKDKHKVHPVELAALVHLKFVTIHPFADGNGRISRLLMNFILHRHKYPLFNIRYQIRSSYYTALERAQTKKLDSIFVQWFLKRYVKESGGYLKK